MKGNGKLRPLCVIPESDIIVFHCVQNSVSTVQVYKFNNGKNTVGECMWDEKYKIEFLETKVHFMRLMTRRNPLGSNTNNEKVTYED